VEGRRATKKRERAAKIRELQPSALGKVRWRGQNSWHLKGGVQTVKKNDLVKGGEGSVSKDRRRQLLKQ